MLINLMELGRLTQWWRSKIKKYIIDSAMYEVDKIVKQACSLLSELTNLN